MTTSPPSLTLADYQLRLPEFEGPLDLLLQLIERAKLPISEVSLVAVTDQFLAHVRELGGIAPDLLADFTAIGARLVLLKSRSLLPRTASPEEAEEVEDLVVRLREYQVIKEAARQLDDRRQATDRSYGPRALVVLPVREVAAPLALHEPVSLVRALRRRLAVSPPPVQLIAGRDRLPIRVVLERILAAVKPGRRVRFTDLVTPQTDRDETMTTFLALLVLVRRRIFDADQQTPFGPIELWRSADIVPALTELVSADSRDAG